MRSPRLDGRYDFDGWFADDAAGLFAVWDGFGGDRAGDLFEFFATDVFRTFVACEPHDHDLSCVSVAGNEERWPRQALDRYSFDRTLTRRSYDPPPLRFSGPTTDVGRVLNYLAEVMSHAIRQFELAYRPLGIGGTLAVVLVRDEALWVGGAGDCRVYVSDHGVLGQLAPDHRWVAQPNVELRHPKMSRAVDYVITKAIGPDNADLEIVRYPLKALRTLLLCTDGLWRHVGDPVIERCLASAESLVPAVDAAKANQSEMNEYDDIALLRVAIE